MGQFRIAIIVVYLNRYKRGHEADFVPPVTGIHLAALTPREFDVRVVHQQVETVDLEMDVDLVALSFFSGFANEAYRLAGEFRRRGKIVVGGGPHVSYNASESSAQFDAIVLGEAESVWVQLLRDAQRGELRAAYRGEAVELDNLPTPRYDLLSSRYFVKRVVQATRGCPFSCSFCTVPTLNPGFRLRPVEQVLRDIAYDDFPYWWQRKVVWFWDDNLTIKRAWVKELLTRMIPLKRWWLTQASLDIARDEELLDLMKESGCIGVFLGIESFQVDSLADANKRQNQIARYHDAVAALHRRGIAVMAGFIAGFEHDTPASIVSMAKQLNQVGIDVPFLSVLTPFRGTPLYNQLSAEGRILKDRGWEYYNGYNVAFQPKRMSADELQQSHRELWAAAFHWKSVLTRWRNLPQLSPGARWLSLFMNGFYGLKRARGNFPIDAALLSSETGESGIRSEGSSAGCSGVRIQGVSPCR